MSQLKIVVRYLSLLLLLGLAVQAGALASDKKANDQLRTQFEPLFATVTRELEKNQAYYLENPSAYYGFIDRELKPRWDASSTTRALIGKQSFQALESVQQAALVEAVEGTLRRYAFEGLEHYSGQVFSLQDVVANESGMGWVQVKMESPVIPDIHLDLLVKRDKQGAWKAVDVRFKGITYVSIKKHEFREILSEQGIQGLIDQLEAKNSQYFQVVCSNAGLEGEGPC